ncbi:hypothetical protein PVAP13_8KG275611 [Panicum virgatum]|uniref:Uncharacterized protein n=1 Tax=Panicum virgatum TaxID=38727 RepID=A0A8T0PI02_PANVG|nr:hypothetical protein PVAP13_8KG275611 [Panicum virgatum]
MPHPSLLRPLPCSAPPLLPAPARTRAASWSSPPRTGRRRRGRAEERPTPDGRAAGPTAHDRRPLRARPHPRTASAVVQVARSVQKRRARPSAVTVSAAPPTGSSSGSCRTSRRGRRGSGAREPAATAAMGREAATAAIWREQRARSRRGGQGRSGPERGSNSGDGQGRRADLGGQGRRSELGGGAPGPSAAAGAAATSGSERGSRSGDGHGRSRPERGSRSGDGQGRRADLGGQGRRADLGGGAPGPSAAAGAAATSGSERGSRSGDDDEAKLQARAPAAGARGQVPAAGWLLIFFVCQKYFGTGWSFQSVPMDV